MSSCSDRLICLQGGLVVRADAYVTALDVERAGHRLVAEGEHLYLERGPGITLDADLAARGRRWRHDLLVLMRYQPDDRHLFDDNLPRPELGPIVIRRP